MNWDAETLRAALEQAGFADTKAEPVESQAEMRILPATLDRWFGAAPISERQSYRLRLAEMLTVEELTQVETLYRGQLTGQTVPWRSVTAFIVAKRSG